MTQLSLGGLGGIVLAPDVLDEQRGAWCSPPEWCERITERRPFDVDPFTNPRSTLQARHECMLERGDDGFGLDRRHVPGTYYVNPAMCAAHPDTCSMCGYHVATEDTFVWIQPDYGFVIEALQHYGHTRFVALLRADTSTVWFQLLFWGIRDAAEAAVLSKKTKLNLVVRPPLCEVVMVPKRDRLEFVPPPGVTASSNPFPHGIFYKRAEDVTPSVVEHSYPWPTGIYPAADPLGIFTAKSCAP